MNVIIVDDEKPARDRLTRLLNAQPNIIIVSEASNGEQALAQINHHQPDLVFLDISMPVMDGMQLANILHSKYPKLNIIFTTAYEEYAIQAFEVQAQDYLLKPIRAERLASAISKIDPTGLANQFITLKDREQTVRVPIQDVICLHADHKYTEVHLAKQQFLSNDSLKEFEARFASTFLRIHRSTLINKNFLMGIGQQKEGVVALLKDSTLTPEISRRHQAKIRQFIQQ